MAISNGPIAVRLLAPAAPIRHPHRVTVRISVRAITDSLHPSWTAGWDWGDGSVDVAELRSARLIRASRAHRYEAPGVYQVQVRIGLGRGEPASGLRYATVSRTRDEIAGCGWITAPSRKPVPFGFLLGVPTPSHPAGHLLMRYRTETFDVAADELAWVIAEPNGVLHFGGSARVGGRRGDHPFRADAVMPLAAPRRPQRLALNLYSPGDVAGRDSPLHRVSGVVWPGRINLAR